VAVRILLSMILIIGAQAYNWLCFSWTLPVVLARHPVLTYTGVPWLNCSELIGVK
jgi:hypothetical protein